MNKMLRTLLCVFGGTVVGATAFGADTGGVVTGVVKEQSLTPLEGATIIMIHTAKGTARVAESNKDGEYTLTDVPIGEYTLTVSKEGFAKSETTVTVAVGKPVVLETTLRAGFTDEVNVVGTVTKGLDMSQIVQAVTYDSSKVDVLPVADDGFEALVLMAPGTVENGAPNAFRGASSIGGASSAENGYYLNGINITQIQSGLGSLNMPWEAIDQTTVQTAGIGAAWGGALGGIVNSVSRTGTNDFHFGLEGLFEPASLRDHPPAVRQVSDPSAFWLNTQQDENELAQYSAWVGGPIVKNKAFFYALFNPRRENYQSAGNAAFSKSERDSNRWFVNAEWFLNKSHSIGATVFDTVRERTTDNFAYNADANTILQSTGQSFGKDGGNFYGLHYHGSLTNRFSVDLVAGRTQEEEVPVPANSLVLMQDCSSGSCVNYSNQSDSIIEPQEFTRDQLRGDFRWDLNSHKLTFGVDAYAIDVFVNNRQNGIFTGNVNDVDTDSALGWWLYGISGSESSKVGSVGVSAYQDGVPAGTPFVRRRVRNRFSDSTVESQAAYLEDSWRVANQLTLDLGVRYTNFKNTVSSGEAYADLTGNIGPRVSAIWDVGGKGTRRLFASYGRHFQPVAARMNITQGSSSVEYFDYYQPVDPGRPALSPDGSPERGARIVPRLFRQTGITDPRLIASKNLKAMYSDQVSLGYNQEVRPGLTASVRVTHNDLGRSVEDTDYGPVLANVLTRMGFIDPNNPARDELRELPPYQGSFYVLANPGEDVEIAYDFNGDGKVDEVTLTAADLRLAKPVRKYTAVDVSLNGRLGNRFDFLAAYTWSHNRGNTEGLVKTENGQADPGWTSDYDYGESLDHAEGDLPNDRRHAIKFNGAYRFLNDLTLGVAARSTSGQPLSILVPHPEGVDSCAPGSPWAACESRSYVGAFYDEAGNPVPRGTAGRMPWVHKVDVSLAYRVPMGKVSLLLKTTAYNVLGATSPLHVFEWAGPDYGLTDTHQTPRFVSFMARVEF